MESKNVSWMTIGVLAVPDHFATPTLFRFFLLFLFLASSAARQRPQRVARAMKIVTVTRITTVIITQEIPKHLSSATQKISY